MEASRRERLAAGAPSWSVEAAGQYPGSMTAVVQLPAHLRSDYREGDELAAFIGEECRGVGEAVEVEGAQLFYVLIHGAAPEEEGIVFKYYSTKASHVFITNTRLSFETDGVFGTVDQPRVLALKSQP